MDVIDLEVQTATGMENIVFYEELNKTSCPYPGEATILSLFAKAVAAHSDRLAAVFGEQRITYGELDRHSGQLADALHHMGVGAGDFVAICAKRGVEMLTALYGVLKTGAAYVPVDPDYPRQRMEYILSDCKAKAVVTYGCTLDIDLPVLDMNRWEPGEEEYLCHCKPTDAAYLIYTSGTTGQPKGVKILHKNVVNFSCQSGFGVYRYGPKNGFTSILSVTNHVFDIFVTEAITSVLLGMTVYIANEEEQMDVRKFSAIVEEYHPQVLQTTPSRIRMYLAQDPTCKALGKFAYMMLGGETVSEELIARLRDLCPQTTLVNVYGPSETTVWSTCANVTDGIITIGKPISNTQVYVLDNYRLCALNEPGELCIAGDGVSPGYLNRPELTKEKFIPNPFGKGSLYCTGDIAALCEDGMLRFYGRKDDQVKILGHRIELSEIDASIRSIEGIRDSAVITREDPSGEKLIFAYYCADVVIEPQEIFCVLKENLPEYMLPAGMMQLSTIPLNANGKLDRKALPLLHVTAGREYTPAETDEQAEICRLFSQLLSVESVGIHDSFFRLGGHSILAAQLVYSLEDRFGCAFSLKEIFSNPTPAMLAELLQNKQEKPLQPMRKAEEKSYYPLSPAQLRMYLSHTVDGGSLQYHLPECLRIGGELEPLRLRQALGNMICRHESLRTRFVLVAGEPMQQILPEAQEIFDSITDYDSTEESIIKNFIRPFDLSQCPLIRIRLVQRKNEQLLLLDMHHIIADGISVELFWEEFFALYNGKELSTLTYQYKDYSEFLRQKDLTVAKDFWLSRFSDEVSVPELPLDAPRSTVRDLSGALISRRVDPTLCTAIEMLSTHRGVTEYMVFLSATMILLGKYGAQEDVTVGTAFSGRTEKETQPMLGMFVNTLAMRCNVNGEETYSSFLEKVRDLSLKAMDCQDYPFEELVQNTVRDRIPGRNPLFDTMLVYHNQGKTHISMGDILVERVPVHTGYSAFDLTFQIEKSEGSFDLSLEFATGLFSEKTAQRIMDHYLFLLSQLCENSERTIGEYSLLSPEEYAEIEVFNQTSAPMREDATIVSLFEEQVRLHENKIALRWGEETLTYRELNDRANALGRKLRKMGICPGDLVALHAPRGIHAFVGILGILKSGGAYLPMDPTLPRERLDFMFSDSGCRAVVYEGEAPAVALPMVELSILTGETQDLPAVTDSRDLAYCIYTSGTTGKPKGVLIEHRGIVNLKQYFMDQYAIVPEDKIVQFANLVFDASVWEWTMALLNGCELVIARERQDLSRFAEEFYRYGVTVATLPPNFYIQLPPIAPRLLITAGSASDRSILGKAEGITYVNAYGPTETTICATAWIRQGTPELPPIGRAIPNMQAHVLKDLTPCAIGEIGELCISGIGLARGYLNRQELTQKKFIHNPFGEGKLYRTGDLVRRLPDGNLLFLGRMDQQVKLRGFRIELGEIEANLRLHSGVKEAVVLLRKDPSGESFLCAYYTCTCHISPEEFRTLLSRELPDYMIPSVYMEVEKIPVTTSGKVDHRALPIPVFGHKREYVAPCTESEKAMCLLFEEILAVDMVGATDSFFALGGHSLRAAQLAYRIEERLHCAISVAEIFARKTPREIGGYIDSGSSQAVTCIPLVAERECYPMSPAQRRMYLVWKMDPMGVTYNMPVFWAFQEKPDPEKLEFAFASMIRRHEILRTVFLMEEGKGLQKVLPDISAPLTYGVWNGTWQSFDQSTFVKPFSLEKGPLLRMELLETADGWVLLFDIHHIIADGLSMELFFREFAQLYNGVSFHTPTVQYKDYSQWILEQDTEEGEKYWKELLLEAPVLDLPTDHSRPVQPSFRGATAYAHLSEELSMEIRRLCQRNEMTDYMVFLAGAMILLSKYARQEDIVLGSAYSGRLHRDTEAMMGMFVNTLALRGNPGGEKTVKQFLEEMRQLSTEAYAYQNYPFETLVDALGIQRHSHRNPLFDVMIAMQDGDVSELPLGELVGESLPYHNQVSKFDLNFLIEEKNGTYHLALEYATDLFEHSTAERMLR
ncbi:MAG: amino acid adenylation domain-containing protein, partial [Oscillospiraceae bacterium]|nr:amino acid adenylation domain-containing protein [Oscillospiraceae bacterium]